jgi:hypothetical protein
VRGVAQAERIGGVDREILVSLDLDRLQAVRLTAPTSASGRAVPPSTSPAAAPKSAAPGDPDAGGSQDLNELD